jgi:hypothetical protein
MDNYSQKAFAEMEAWQHNMQRRPGYFNSLSKKMQDKLNSYIPEKVHSAITQTIKQMFRAVLFTAEYITSKPRTEGTLEIREAVILEKIETYKKTAAVEGGVTGAGGILLGIADFPLLIGIKLKLLFEIAAMYGFALDDYKERVFVLHIFQLAFCSNKKRNLAYKEIENWNEKAKNLPDDINHFDWRSFQQEYRDYLDIAKLLQLIPIVGAPIGAFVNYRLIKKLGTTAMNAYRMRLFEKNLLDAGTTGKNKPPSIY